MRRVNHSFDRSKTSRFMYRFGREKIATTKSVDGWDVVDSKKDWRIVQSSGKDFGIQYFNGIRWCNLMINGRHTFTHDLVALRKLFRKVREDVC